MGHCISYLKAYDSLRIKLLCNILIEFAIRIKEMLYRNCFSTMP
jgi:hypothetical protein